MGTTLTESARNAACDAVVGLLDVGYGDNPTLEIRASNETVLVAIDLPGGGVFGAASGGVAEANEIDEADVAETGTADHWVAKDKDGVARLSGDVGGTGSGASLILSDVELTATEKIQVTGWTHTQPASV